VAKRFSQKPSSFLAIADPYAAYCLDMACFSWGAYVEGELESIEGKNAREIKAKRERKLAKLLGEKPKYRDPAGFIKK